MRFALFGFGGVVVCALVSVTLARAEIENDQTDPRHVSLAQNKEVRFNRDIRPILSDRCFLCHGPDDTAREADLRLDDPAAALDAIVPGDADASELLSRIASEDPGPADAA